MRILLVDDHPITRRGTEEWIKAIEPMAEVVHAKNAADCMAQAEKDHFDLVFLDLALPDRPGLEALAELKEEYPTLPVVILSAVDDDATVLEAIRRGAMGFVPKTAEDPDVFRGYLARALRGDVALPIGMVNRQSWSGVRGGVPKSASDFGLTPRQIDVLRHLLTGMANKEIARELKISRMTVRDYVSELLAIFGVKNRVQLVIEVGRCGLVLRQGAAERDLSSTKSPMTD